MVSVLIDIVPFLPPSPPLPVFYPTDPGTYAPVVFIPGGDGIVYAEWYSVAMSNFASYGYIIAGVDLFWPVMGEASEPRGINTLLPDPKTVHV